MTKAKHSPGPFSIDTDRSILCAPDAAAPAGGRTIAEVYSWMGTDVADANARLFEASPDLLWNLKRILEDLPTNRDWLDPAVEKFAREAVKKAEGDE